VARQAGEIRARWAWAEECVWTDRMLTALENGVKGGKWFSLVDKVCSYDNLSASFEKVRANKGAAGMDHVSVEMFEARLDENLRDLVRELKEGAYRPRPVRRVWIPKPGSKELRPLGIPTVKDRVVQGALRQTLEPIFERDFSEYSCGFRPGRGAKDALRRVDGLLHAGYVFAVDADLKGYFDSIPHDRLLAKVAEKVSDGRVLELVDLFLHQNVLDGEEETNPLAGTPQGAVLSPLLANLYLDPLDHLAAARGYEMTRYADDFVILCRSREEADAALTMVREWTQAAGLVLHPEKTHIVDAREKGGFDFLGYHFERGYKWPRKKSLDRLKDFVRSKTRRCNGHSLKRVVDELNRTLRGWFEYFKHSIKYTFSDLDGWIRGRLRSILRKRRGGEGRGRGKDHQRWPNAFFADLGLFSLKAAHRAACRSSRR